MVKNGKFRPVRLFLAVLFIYVLVLSTPHFVRLLYPLEYKGLIISYGKQHNIDPPLLAALIKTESNFDANAESSKGAKGLMQITPSTGEWIAETIGMEGFTESRLYDPETNIMLGSWYIEHLTNYYNGSFKLIFAAYNGGRGNVDKWLNDKSLSSNGKTLDTIPFSETENFVKRIEKNYNIYKRIYSWGNDE